MKNWKTSLFGIVGAIGTTLAAQENPTMKLVGGIITAASLLLMGASAKDNNVTGGGSNPVENKG